MANNSDKKENKDEMNQLEVSTEEETAQGVYSNLARITFTENEFILGFVLNIENEAHLVSRVIVSPDHMEDLSEAMQKSLNEYKDQFED